MAPKKKTAEKKTPAKTKKKAPRKDYLKKRDAARHTALDDVFGQIDQAGLYDKTSEQQCKEETSELP